jgi:hypothetical protein
MQIGRKVYYELQTGDVVLITPEKFSGTPTTKEQDFAMYEALSIRNPETVGAIQLEYGQHSSDFQTCNSVRVDLDTGGLLFNYPVFEAPLSVQINALRTENTELRAQNQTLNQQVSDLEMAIASLLGGAA